MGVVTLWPKKALPPPPPPPYNLSNDYFYVFYVLRCNLFAFYKFKIVKTTHLPMHLTISVIKFLLLKLKNGWGKSCSTNGV